MKEAKRDEKNLPNIGDLDCPALRCGYFTTNQHHRIGRLFWIFTLFHNGRWNRCRNMAPNQTSQKKERVTIISNE